MCCFIIDSLDTDIKGAPSPTASDEDSTHLIFIMSYQTVFSVLITLPCAQDSLNPLLKCFTEAHRLMYCVRRKPRKETLKNWKALPI